uniref:C-C motif chemokine n=13 Tax=Cercopithecinae TaxID=9528 RepID=G7PU47_MACFA|nr:PREDICTED: C-C motif chemokine 5 [Macaca fascicularis]
MSAEKCFHHWCLVKGETDELTLDERAVRGRQRLEFPEAISVFFSVMCNFTYDTGQCLVAILETPLRGYPLTGPIKSQPELQRIPAEDPVTARGPPTASPTGTMKVSVAALAVILVATALCAPASASPHASDTTPCCFAYIARPLPRAHIKEYFYTSGKCSNPAVVFVTRKNRQVCANPEKKWVREYINSLEMS